MPDSGLNLDEFDLDIESSKSSTSKGKSSPKEDSKPKSNRPEIPKVREEERLFVEYLVKELKKNWDRASGILTNLKNSKVFDITGDPSENKNIIGNLHRDFEQEVFHGVEDISSKFKEITAFPKTITSYSMYYNKSQKDKLLLVGNDRAKLDMILSWEMQSGISNQLKKFGKMMSELMYLINQKSASGLLKSLNPQQHKLFEDAKTSALFCLGEVDALRRLVEKWQAVNFE
ncbi:MAG: hypothetical protein KDK36_06690 [Leptospiraceae bacterium]|nr:hypothetical protein [Leptospiraceae bacterium]